MIQISSPGQGLSIGIKAAVPIEFLAGFPDAVPGYEVTDRHGYYWFATTSPPARLSTRTRISR